MKWYKISNADGKVWIMPSNNLKTGLELYQPSGTKGKLLKRFFPYLHHFKPVRDKCGAITSDYALNDKLSGLAERIFKTDKLEFSIFEGTPSVHQKTTIQIFKGQKILGYAKISDKPEIVELFKKEKDFLGRLVDSGVRNIPKPLYFGDLDNDSFLFIQDTQKILKSKSPENWTIQHENFLKELRDKSLQEIKFEITSLYDSLAYLYKNLPRLPDDVSPSKIKDSIDDILRVYSGKNVSFSVYHADFTPWNMFMNGENLFVFDWEYSSRYYPAGLDKYHFHLQQWIHVKHWNADKIFDEINKQPWFDHFIFKIYLTDIISRYLKREEEIFSNSFIYSLKIWVSLLQKLKFSTIS